MSNDIDVMKRRLGCNGLDLAGNEGGRLADVAGVKQPQAVGQNQVSHLG